MHSVANSINQCFGVMTAQEQTGHEVHFIRLWSISPSPPKYVAIENDIII